MKYHLYSAGKWLARIFVLGLILFSSSVINAKSPDRTGVTLTITTTADEDDGHCTYHHCSLREAINLANKHPNFQKTIAFNIPGNGPHQLQLTSPLPVIQPPIIINGATQPGASCDTQPPTLPIELNGNLAGSNAIGLEINGLESIIRGLTIRQFSGAGIRIHTRDNLLECNQIIENQGDGVEILSGHRNTLRRNLIFNNGELGIDLAGDDPTPNDTADPDTGPNNLQNYPAILSATSDSGGTLMVGRLNSTPNTDYTLEFFSNVVCDPSGFGEGEQSLGTGTYQTDEAGNIYFTQPLAATDLTGQFITATATDAAGNTSEFSKCMRVGLDNVSWPKALPLDSSITSVTQQRLTQSGQSRWYKFPVEPGSRLIVTLTNLPENYDLTLYKDIALAFKSLNSPEDLVRLSAEFAPDAFAPDAFAPDAFAPDAFAPDAFAPDAFAPDAFAPDAFAPDAFAP